MIRALLAGCFLLLASSAAYANDYPHDWIHCETDQQCVVAYECVDVAVNRDYLDEFNKAATKSCRASLPHNPNAAVECVKHSCTVMPQR